MKKWREYKSIWIISTLLSLNILFFVGSSFYFNSAKYVHTENVDDLTENDYIESGWRLVNWSLSMFRFFKGNDPKSANY